MGQRRGDHDAAVARQRRGNDLRAAQFFHLRIDGGPYFFGFGRAVGEQNGAGQDIVFGLRQEIRRDKSRVRVGVSHDHRFSGTGQAVDAHNAEELAFGQGGEQV